MLPCSTKYGCLPRLMVSDTSESAACTAASPAERRCKHQRARQRHRSRLILPGLGRRQVTSLIIR